MDALASSPISDASARTRSSSVARARAESKKVYFSGILILFVVVFLWTASNFVTQVRHLLPVLTWYRSLGCPEVNVVSDRIYSWADGKSRSCTHTRSRYMGSGRADGLYA
jgi:hypothetical protein